MDLTFTPAQESLRKELSDFIKVELPLGIDDEVESEEAWEFSRRFAQKLVKRKWLAIGWPPEYGGAGYGRIETNLFQEVFAYNRALFYTVHNPGLTHVGAQIMFVASEDQKKRFLPRIASGELIVSNGLTEPEAGSDIANLRMRAVRQGDHYVLNGQKTFQSGAHHANWIRLAVRTNPAAEKHRGISLVMCDLKSPGVTVRRMPQIADDAQQGINDVFFDDVKVPAENLLGQENLGWQYMMTGLAFERGRVTVWAQVQRVFDDFVEFCKEAKFGDRLLSKDPWVRHRLAECAVSLKVWYHLSWRVIWMCSEEIVPNIEAGTQWVFGRDVRRLVAESAMDILGMYGLLQTGSRWAPLAGRVENLYRGSVESHGGGTTDIVRTVMATRGLGLPR